MEVADQWRREWAGTAEYGKVTEGGVTRRIARAMEVLHASGPGARVRVMRAAYHSSAAPGAPASSFMLHSSRRVISSGFNLLESPSSPMKPLEISSTPFESSPEPTTENYKVTEPDDFEISEPSKWRGSTKGSAIRMPSEESSSTDNASIIDLDARLGRNLHRKYSYDSECSDIHSSRNTSRNSPLLDTPVTLSTLKYKSLLNSSNEWNTRRKSYSFEDTSPLNETITHSNDTLAMESSTDSGICKSTEIVDDQMDDYSHTKHFSRDERKTPNNEESFRDWLSKNRPTSHYRGTKFKTYREHDIVLEEPLENNITLQSTGKVSITLPVTVETDSDDYNKKHQVTEEGDRKVKRVEFCKTELHFAAESGKVNIIATDEKPPPSTDFRKRRSAFVPMKDMIEKPITLFGEKNDFSAPNGIGTPFILSSSEIGESDENTAATKSILKNKIPKPKPYLLGENMAFGTSDELLNKDSPNDCVLSAVSLVNKQLQSEKRYNNEVKSIFAGAAEDPVMQPNVLRTVKAGPTKQDSFKQEKQVVTHIKIDKASDDTTQDVKSKFNKLQVSPAQRKPKTRQLRDSELTYFGVDSGKADSYNSRNSMKSSFKNSGNESIFQSVKLIQQVSSSVCNSEPESDESPEYQNLPLNINYAPVPTPRLRSKYEDKPNEINEIQVLKPIIEKESQERTDVSYTRRSRSRRQDEVTARSISAPPKSLRRDSTERSHKREDQSTRSSRVTKDHTKHDTEKIFSTKERKLSEDKDPIYVNLNDDIQKSNTLEKRDIQKLKTNSLNSRQRKSQNTELHKSNKEQTSDTPSSSLNYSDRRKERRSDSGTDNSLRTKHSIHKDTISRSAYKDTLSRRAQKIDKPQNSSDKSEKIKEDRKEDKLNITKEPRKHSESKSSRDKKSSTEKTDHRSRSLQRPTSNVPQAESEETSRDRNRRAVEKADHKYNGSLDENHAVHSGRKRNSSRDKSTKETVKSSQKQESVYTAQIPVVQSRGNDKDLGTKMNATRSNARKEYVINYDDKNGTVSSICKIQPSLGTPRRKKTSKDVSKYDKALKHKSVDKVAPLQLQDHQGERNGLNYADRKWKTKVHLQRSCQVL
ncbi:uncharacterized protein LOC124630950 [Helicoverpa zea]|uniref:uncharacterized protein LOC124630950 n=1 Tax=Helicoverpa zea TaxID=7113 RepID=UPI001F586398|nr:uncharacterized protein LOC124630950 [Helicoverpa zea]